MTNNEQPKTAGKTAQVKHACFKCGTEATEFKRWYHGDQDDLICLECAKVTRHTDTSYMGQCVSEMKTEKPARAGKTATKERPQPEVKKVTMDKETDVIRVEDENGNYLFSFSKIDNSIIFNENVVRTLWNKGENYGERKQMYTSDFVEDIKALEKIKEMATIFQRWTQ